MIYGHGSFDYHDWIYRCRNISVFYNFFARRSTIFLQKFWRKYQNSFIDKILYHRLCDCSTMGIFVAFAEGILFMYIIWSSIIIKGYYYLLNLYWYFDDIYIQHIYHINNIDMYKRKDTLTFLTVCSFWSAFSNINLRFIYQSERCQSLGTDVFILTWSGYCFKLFGYMSCYLILCYNWKSISLNMCKVTQWKGNNRTKLLFVACSAHIGFQIG